MSDFEPEPVILAVDTALGACSVAVMMGERILAHRFETMARGHAEKLAPMVRDAMMDAGLGFDALARLAVTTGPGTFTGQRVGLAFMRAVRLALKIPLCGITTLEAMAAAAQAESGRPRAAVLHDARRGEVYLLLRDGDAVVQQPVVLVFGEAVARIRAFGSCTLAGSGAEAAAATLGRDFVSSSITQPDALWVARLARALPPSADVPGPLYLRAPDVTRPKAKQPPRSPDESRSA